MEGMARDLAHTRENLERETAISAGLRVELSKREVLECVVCRDARPSKALLPCGHVCLCAACCQRSQDSTMLACPMCRQPAKFIVDVFL